MKLNEVEMYNAHPWLLIVPRVGIVVLSSSLSNIFQKMLASFRRKAYLCIRLAASQHNIQASLIFCIRFA